ncbi:MAG: sortase [Chloroflexi bacterium]|nr:sortase [Chloroflexota bacterium]
MSPGQKAGSSRWASRLSLGLMALGALLVLGTGAYYAYAAVAVNQLSSLNVSASTTPSASTPPPPTPLATASPPPTATIKPRAERLVIPAIGVDTKVMALSQVAQDGKLVWERAPFVAGWLEGTANPGEGGNIALAGELTSPTQNLGNVFRRLPEIPLLLDQYNNEGNKYPEKGLPVDISVYAGGKEYRYRVTKTLVVEPKETWVIGPTPTEQLTLITCVPDYIYSHRLIVIAEPY